MTPNKARRHADTQVDCKAGFVSLIKVSVTSKPYLSCLWTVLLCAAPSLVSLVQFGNLGVTKKEQSAPTHSLPSCLVARLSCSAMLQQRLY